MRKHPITVRVLPGKTLGMVIKAVEDLLSYYKNPRLRRFDGLKCSLCRLFNCEFCLWVIFHHMCCDDFAVKRFDTDASSLKRNKEWRALRVKELTYWLKELKRRGVKCIGAW